MDVEDGIAYDRKHLRESSASKDRRRNNGGAATQHLLAIDAQDAPASTKPIVLAPVVHCLNPELA